MLKSIGAMLMFLLFFSAASVDAGDTGKSRDQIQDKYKWDLAVMFKDNAAWEAQKKDVEGQLDKFEKFKGKLGSSAEMLYECLEFDTKVSIDYRWLASYASKLSDQDIRESGPLAMNQEMNGLGTKFAAATSFIRPEILAIEEETIKKFMKDKPELQVYKQVIDDIQRLKAHTLDKEGEKLIAQAGLMEGAAYDGYSIFKNADMPRPEIKVGEEMVTMDDAAYTLHRADADRETRKRVFEKFFGKYKDFERTFGAQLFSQVKRDMFYKNVRNYKSSLESALNANNIPTSVYTSLIKGVHDNLDVLHRYLNLRKRMLGLNDLHYYDMYPSMVKKVEMSYTIEEANDLMLKSLVPLGPDYIATLEEAFANRWIDVYPNTGKRSGAYSSGYAYGAHPYILLNYNGQYEDVSTLAHELGHTMHSYYSNKNQKFANSDYPIFLAEVASTTNEALLIDYVLKHTEDPQKRLSLLGSQLEGYRQTLFRQTQFAEFELKMHELAETGEALTGEKLTGIYLDILKKYYGHDKGVTVIDDIYGIEWAYIPHFYYNFYVFQYATSLCASAAVSEKILTEGESMAKKFHKNFLSAGGSKYPIPIMKSIGVDMTTSEPFNLAMKRMNTIMDEMEKILDEK